MSMHECGCGRGWFELSNPLDQILDTRMIRQHDSTVWRMKDGPTMSITESIGKHRAQLRRMTKLIRERVQSRKQHAMVGGGGRECRGDGDGNGDCDSYRRARATNTSTQRGQLIDGSSTHRRNIPIAPERVVVILIAASRRGTIGFGRRHTVRRGRVRRVG
jgi:hypothetical protein